MLRLWPPTFGKFAEVARNLLACGNSLSSIFSAGLGRRTRVRLRDGTPVELNGLVPGPGLTLLALSTLGATFDPASPRETRWGFESASGVLTAPCGVRLLIDKVDPIVLAETFIWDVHFVGFSLAGKAVVDGGAYVGDTALYFAKLGAAVFAYEPDPENFARLQANLDLNPDLRKQVTIRNAALGPDGEVGFTSGRQGSSGRFASGTKRIQVPSVSLATVVRSNHLESPYLLKLDVKGAEHELVEQDAIREFSHLQIEYDTVTRQGTLASLLAGIREKGFEKVRVFKHNMLPFHLGEHGVIYAERSKTFGTGP